MQKLTQSGQPEQSFGLTSAENQDKETLDSNIHRPIVNSPFWLRKYKDTGYFVTLGKYRLTPEEPTEEAALSYVKVDNWEFLLTTVAAMIDQVKKPD